ncbi:hypothetical protein [Pseudomonas sp. DSP3-2-2]|uniref:hypothetical protein n=1 Tax=unclassified Pseudomonas TaxID=196821 RepID=UPI003CEFA016
MNNKTIHRSPDQRSTMDLAAAVERFVAQGGVIDVIKEGNVSPPRSTSASANTSDEERNSKVHLLKDLVAKGAGMSALQYSLRMNRKEIKQLAFEHGVKIAFSRPISEIKREALQDPMEIDDLVAGHAMHYSSLGYTAVEIARLLDLTVRQVWDIGRAYRFEFQLRKDGDTP